MCAHYIHKISSAGKVTVVLVEAGCTYSLLEDRFMLQVQFPASSDRFNDFITTLKICIEKFPRGDDFNNLVSALLSLSTTKLPSLLNDMFILMSGSSLTEFNVKAIHSSVSVDPEK